MIAALIVFLIAMDLVLLLYVLRLGRQRINPIDVLKEIHEEKRLAKELHASFREEAMQIKAQTQDLHQRMSRLATEAEMEIQSSGKVLSAELDRLMVELTQKVDGSAQDVSRHRTALSHLIQKSQQERQLISKSVAKAEKLVKFFKSKVPVDEVLEEIEDKKYVDARHLLTKGLSVDEVAIEVGLPISEVKLLATVS